MIVLLIDHETPLRTRLAGAISELADVQLQIQEPGSSEVDTTITELRPDVVLIDIDESRGSGLEMIKRIRARRQERRPVIMAIASSASIRYRESCLEAGAMYFFNCMREQDWLLESLASIREQLG